MSPTIVIVIVVVVVVAVGLALLRKRPAELPDDTAPKPEPKRVPPEATGPKGTEPGDAEPVPVEAEASDGDGGSTDAAPVEAEAAHADGVADDGGSDDVAPVEAEAADAEVAPAEEAPAPEPAKPPSRRAPSPEEVAALKKGLANTRGGFISKLAKLFGGKREIDPGLLDEVEEVLIGADLGAHTTQRILDSLRERLDKSELADADAVWAAIEDEARLILDRPATTTAPPAPPKVILVVGVNGVGKTTTIGKLAKRHAEAGEKVLLAAGDTFRAAAVLQLEVWGRRTGATVVKGKDRADPGSVIFDAVKRGMDEGFDLVIADTAGRLHTKTPLMDELQKVGRTLEKALGRPADETLLVLDATTGQNAIQQAELFKEALPLSGIVLTKLDGSAKGGVVLGIVDRHDLPIHYLGVGERVEDLREFDPASFAAALFERPEEAEVD